MNIIFLDIDGVVNTLMISTTPFNTNRGTISRNGFYYKLNTPNDLEVSNVQAVMWLNKLCKKTNSKIVITSTWRIEKDGFEKAKKALYNTGLLKDIEIIGATPYLSSNRGYEIKEWLKNNKNVINYVILDDDCDMLKEQRKHLVLINTFYGFGFPDYKKAIDILEG